MSLAKLALGSDSHTDPPHRAGRPESKSYGHGKDQLLTLIDSPVECAGVRNAPCQPDSLGKDLYRSALRDLAECRDRAAELVEEHRDAIIAFATVLYARRRLAGAELEEALAQAGVRATIVDGLTPA